MAKSKVNFNWIGQTIADRYKIEALLGQGGMSTVYRANDPNLNRKVAVKIIHPHLSNDPEFVRRFKQEAAAVAQLRHPNIIQVYDFDHDGNVYYMIMEYVPGETLKEKLQKLNAAQERLPLAETIQIMATMGEAVGYAHEQGMIHRDLKPANVMLTPKGEAILMDFGVAKMLEGSDNTATGAVVGTAKYMSPEQARGERPDERSDIYSLGVMLYEMVAGQPPFDADTTIAILMKHVTEPIPDIQRVQKDVPDDLAMVIEKALAKDRTERYQTAAYMTSALRLANRLNRTGGPVTDAKATVTSKRTPPAEPPPTKESIPVARGKSSLMNQRAILFAAGGGILLLLLLGVIGFVIFGGGSAANGEEDGVVSTGEGSELPSSEGMVRVEAGSYTVGLDNADRDHVAVQQVSLDEFWIDQREATNAQYAEFLNATNTSPPAGWPEGNFPSDEAERPVHGITWDDAAAFCEWAQKRLPDEAEWEVAARGTEGRLYPWGDNQRAVELPRSGTYNVGTKLTNQSPFGVLDMAGNVWEWVGEPYAPVEEGHRVLRGGANDFMKDMAYRLQGDPTLPTMVASAGVRCAASEVEVIEIEVIADQNVLYQDTFIDPGSGWPIQSEEIVFFGYHPPDFYHVQVGTANSYTAVSLPQLFEDVTVEAEVQVDSTDTEAGAYRYGLALRRTSKDQFYAFTVSPRSGEWTILKSSGSDLAVLAEGQVNSLRGFAPAGFAPETNDTLRVDAQGSEFVFHINEEVVGRVSDAEYSSGEVGFFVQTFDESRAHIHYDSLVVREAEVAEAPVATVLYEDDFTNPATGWIQEDEAEKPYRVGYHPPDYYHVEVRTPEDHIVVTEPQSFDEMTVETEFFVDSTDTEGGDFRYGLALHRTDDQYYAFTVSSRKGSWAILKSTPAGLEALAEGSVGTLRGFAPPGFSPDKSDTLRVDAAGSEFLLHVNGEPVALIRDEDYSSGEIGFFVETMDEDRAHIHYNGLTVRPVDRSALASFETSPASEPDSSGAPEEEDAATPSEEEDEPATAEPAPPTATPISSTGDQIEGMALVPAGRFLMGSASGEANEQPEHEVSLDAFLIDQFEVSNAQYRACVEAGSCTASRLPDSYTYQNYRDDPAYDHYPVINISWDQAVTYCEWAEKRLPTEAEWEYAASGPDNFEWPWGNSFDSQLSAASASDTQPVDSYPEGVSPFGVYNMAGNVIEWVQDVFDEDFYTSSEGSHNPVNDGEAGSRILRGGSFDNTEADLYRTSRRLAKTPTFYDVDTGFRCAKEAQ